MIEQAPVLSLRRSAAGTSEYLLRQGLLKLLEIKDSDIRILTMEQCRDAADKGLHAGGAFSATIPLVALFYGGYLNLDVEDPTRLGQDTILSSAKVMQSRHWLPFTPNWATLTGPS